MRRAFKTVSMVLLAIAPRLALAEGPVDQAARSFRAGAEAYARRDFAAAARAFEAAYRIAPRGAPMYNAGLAWEGAGDPARAADAYAIAATAVDTADGHPARHGDAASRLKALEAKLARLVVRGPPDAHVSVDGAPEAAAPLNVHLAPGRHALRASFADGRDESRTFDTSASQEVEIRLSETPPTPPPAPAPAATPRLQPAPPNLWSAKLERSTDSGAAARRSLGWIALGGAVVAGGAAALFYEQGLSARDQFANGGQTDAGLRDQATTLRTLTQVSWGVAGGLGAIAGVLLWSSWSAAAAPASGGGSASLSVGPRGVRLSGAF